MLRTVRAIGLVAVCVFVPLTATAAPIAIDFEGLFDSELVTNQFVGDGVTFENATVLSSGAVGGLLNEFEFPPSSGVNVVVDDGGAIRLIFSTPVSSFSAVFTYSTKLTLTAFDSFNTMVAGPVNSVFDNNLLFTNQQLGLNRPSNELIGLWYAAGISSITILGDPGGGSFVMDDVAATQVPVDTPVIPEPASLVLALTGLSALMARRRDRRRSR